MFEVTIKFNNGKEIYWKPVIRDDGAVRIKKPNGATTFIGSYEDCNFSFHVDINMRNLKDSTSVNVFTKRLYSSIDVADDTFTIDESDLLWDEEKYGGMEAIKELSISVEYTRDDGTLDIQTVQYDFADKKCKVSKKSKKIENFSLYEQYGGLVFVRGNINTSGLIVESTEVDIDAKIQEFKESRGFDHKTFACIGSFDNFSSSQLGSIINNNHGQFQSRVSSDVDFMICGKRARGKKLETAKELNIPMISEAEFIKMFELDEDLIKFL